MSHIYRAFFAPMGMRQEPLRNSKGQVTQAVFVFTNMLRKLLKDEKPEYIAAVFESEEDTFRHDSYADYKANRQEMPDDLASQIPYIVRVCEAFCIPILKADGFEADDVIGTLAKKIAEKGMQAVIVSNDKDLCQLVRDPHIVAMRQNSHERETKGSRAADRMVRRGVGREQIRRAARQDHRPARPDGRFGRQHSRVHRESAQKVR